MNENLRSTSFTEMLEQMVVTELVRRYCEKYETMYYDALLDVQYEDESTFEYWFYNEYWNKQEDLDLHFIVVTNRNLHIEQAVLIYHCTEDRETGEIDRWNPQVYSLSNITVDVEYTDHSVVNDREIRNNTIDLWNFRLIDPPERQVCITSINHETGEIKTCGF